MKNTPTTSSTSKDSTTSRKQKYKKSTAFVLYEWAKDRPEYEEEKVQLRQQQFRDEQTISRLAFFRLSAKVYNQTIFKNINSSNSINSALHFIVYVA